ncbi:MAG TPA: methyltransferase domain-containing protein [Acetobacteraceae bacterium]|nr:methyltransferase domain-containing protein [Acetobacteraceae bacterium]
MSLAVRSSAGERMDTDCTGFADYQRCLRDLSRVNVVTRTYRPTLAWLARETQGLAAFSLLDVGCGHGDMLRRIRRWARRRGIAARLEGIDLNPWSSRAAADATPADADIRYRTGDVFGFQPDLPFDFVISAQFAHHLDDAAVVGFIRWMEAHARRGWLISDLHRHRFAYHGFGVLARVAGWHRFVRHDGPVSIARGFLPRDLLALAADADLAPGAAALRRHVPFRLTLARRCAGR